jgi:hypothetical protein
MAKSSPPFFSKTFLILKIDSSFFASNLFSCSHTFFDVDNDLSSRIGPLHLEDLQFEYLEWVTSFKICQLHTLPTLTLYRQNETLDGIFIIFICMAQISHGLSY